MTRTALPTTLVIGLSLFASSEALACRVPPQPSLLRSVKADAIVLAQIANVEDIEEQGWRRWAATATKTQNVWGSTAQIEFKFADTGNSCGPGKPSDDGYWLFYLKKEGHRFQVSSAWPFWWARASMDTRLQRLDTVLPLGLVRAPTAHESRTLDAVEQMISDEMQGKKVAEIIRAPLEVGDLSRFTRVYSRSSPRWLSVEMFRSRTPQRLVSDIREQGPTEASCKCKLYHGVIELEESDLRSWGHPVTSGDD